MNKQTMNFLRSQYYWWPFVFMAIVNLARAVIGS